MVLNGVGERRQTLEGVRVKAMSKIIRMHVCMQIFGRGKVVMTLDLGGMVDTQRKALYGWAEYKCLKWSTQKNVPKPIGIHPLMSSTSPKG